jgi:hypothetical protein
MLFNETHSSVEATIELPVEGLAEVFDPWTATNSKMADDGRLALAGHSFLLIVVDDV